MRAWVVAAVTWSLALSACVEAPQPNMPEPSALQLDCGERCGVLTAAQRSSEPSAAIDPTDPQRMFVAAIEGSAPPVGLPGPAGNLARWQYPGWAFLTVRHSVDGGLTWKRTPIPHAGTAPPTSRWGGFCVTADPVALFDAAGKAYLFGLGWPCSQSQPPLYPSQTSVGSIWMATSPDAGASWGEPQIVTQSPGAAEWPDKEWAAIDPKTGAILVVWQGITATDMLLRFAVSRDGGVSWTAPASITSLSQEGSRAVLMPFVTFDAAGSAYVAYRSCGSGECLKVARSSDLATWRSVTVAPVKNVQREGAASLMTWVPALAHDAQTGRLVATWHGGSNGSDVWFASSMDGSAWTPPQAINIDTAEDDTDQFLSMVATSGDGFAHAFYYDRGSGNGTQARYGRIDLVTGSVRLGAGSSILEPKLPYASFNGDYQAAAAVPGRALIAWAQSDETGSRPVFASVFD